MYRLSMDKVAVGRNKDNNKQLSKVLGTYQSPISRGVDRVVDATRGLIGGAKDAAGEAVDKIKDTFGGNQPPTGTGTGAQPTSSVPTPTPAQAPVNNTPDTSVGKSATPVYVPRPKLIALNKAFESIRYFTETDEVQERVNFCIEPFLHKAKDIEDPLKIATHVFIKDYLPYLQDPAAQFQGQPNSYRFS